MPSNSKQTVKRRAQTKRRSTAVPVNASQSLTHPASSSASTAAIVSPWMPLFPSSTRRRLRYAENNIVLGAAAGTVSNYIFRCNDLFDPNYTSTGHQPMGFDQMMLYFTYFVVERALIQVRFVNNNAALSTVYIRIDGNNGTVTDPVQILETGGCVTDVLSAAGYGSSQKTLRCTLDAPKFFGINPSALTSSDALQGAVGASPTDGVYFHVGCWDQKGSTSAVLAEVIIEYDAIFLEPLVPSLSRHEVVRDAGRQRKIVKALRDGRIDQVNYTS